MQGSGAPQGNNCVLSEIDEHESKCIQLHQVRADTCLRVTKQPFTSARRDAPVYSRLVAISNKYGYIVAGTPTGISAFRTADAEDALVNGKPPSDDQPVELAKRNEISVGKVTHIGLSADELSVIVALATGSILVFSTTELLQMSNAKPVKTIPVNEEIRDIRPNPLEMPMLVAVLTLSGTVLMIDIAQGTTKKIIGSNDAKVTCICWSRKGKQIVCGDVKGMLTQRTPTDGVAKRVIKPVIADDHPESFAVLSVDWIETYTFMAIYGEFPPGGFMAGHGGGGDGSTDDDDEFGNIQTAAYVITQAGKQAPMHWRYIVDPCGAFEFPKRYPGFHFASIYDWGKSAPHLQFLTSAGSAEVMTIANCLPSMVEGEQASGDVPDWCVLDTDPFRAQLPLAVVNTDESDTASLGMAIDFTSKRNLPPLSPEDSTEPIPPQPIMWILTTDGCLAGHYIYNTVEIEGSQQYAGMVKSVQALPGAAAGTAALTATASASTAKVNEAPVPAFAKTGASGGAFGSILGDKSANSQGPSQGFGAAQGFTPSFGMSSSAAFGAATKIEPNANAPTAFGISGQRTFGQGMGASGSSSSGVSFASFAEKGADSSTSIFDQPASGPSIFDQPRSAFGSTKEKKPSFWGEPVEVAPRTKKDTPTLFAGAKSGANATAPAPFGSAKQSISVTPSTSSGSWTTANKDKPISIISASAATSVFAQARKPEDSKQPKEATAATTSVFAQARKSSDLKAADAKPTSPKPVSPRQATPSASVFKPSSLKLPKSPPANAGSASVPKKSPVIAEKHVSFAATLVKQSEPVKSSSAEELAEARKLAEDNQKKIDDEHRARRAEKEKKAVDEKERAAKEQRAEEREERRRIREQKHRKEEERRAEKKRRAELRKDLQRMSNDMISNQFVSTINKFDGELEQFRTSLQRSRRTIRRVRNTALPPIEIDESVTKLASATVRLESLKIGDIGSWDSFASVLAEALSQARDDIEATRVGMRDEQVEMSRVDARGAEIERILASANSMRAAPNATVDGGMNPLEREIRRQMRTSLITLREESEKASQLLEAQEAKHAGSAGLLGIRLQATSPEYIDRKINSIADALEKNSDVIDRLSQELDEMGVARLSAADIEMSSRYAPEIPGPPVVQSSQTDPRIPLRTAADGLPWSQQTLPFSAADVADPTDPMRTPVMSPAQNQHFPHTQVRTLTRRTVKLTRRQSLVPDSEIASLELAAGQGTSRGTLSQSAASTFIEARRRRTLVKDALTSKGRGPVVVLAAKTPKAKPFLAMDSEGSVVPEPLPLPNMVRYVKAFGMLSTDGQGDMSAESESDSEYECKPEPVLGSRDSEDDAEPWPKTEPVSDYEEETDIEYELEVFHAAIEDFVCGIPVEDIVASAVPAPVLATKFYPGWWAQQSSAEFSAMVNMFVRRTPVEDVVASAMSMPKEFPARMASATFSTMVDTLVSQTPVVGIVALALPASEESPASKESAVSEESHGSKEVLALEESSAFEELSESEESYESEESSGSEEVSDSEDSSDSEETPAPPPASGFEVAAVDAGKWKCGTCDLLSPDSSSKCVVCDAPKPGGAGPEADKPATSTVPIVGGFMPSVSLSFGSNSKQDLSVIAGFEPKQTFRSFVPPTTDKSSSEDAADAKALRTSSIGESKQMFRSFVPPIAEQSSAEMAPTDDAATSDNDSDEFIHVSQQTESQLEDIADDLAEAGNEVPRDDRPSELPIATEAKASPALSQAALSDAGYIQVGQDEEPTITTEEAGDLAALSVAKGARVEDVIDAALSADKDKQTGDSQEVPVVENSKDEGVAGSAPSASAIEPAAGVSEDGEAQSDADYDKVSIQNESPKTGHRKTAGDDSEQIVPEATASGDIVADTLSEDEELATDEKSSGVSEQAIPETSELSVDTDGAAAPVSGTSVPASDVAEEVAITADPDAAVAAREGSSAAAKELPEAECVDITQQASCAAVEDIANNGSAEDEIAEVADDNGDTTQPLQVDEPVSEDASQLVDVSEAELPSADNGAAEQTMSNIATKADIDEAPPSDDFEFLSHPGSMGGTGRVSQSDLRTESAPAAVFGMGAISSSLADAGIQELDEEEEEEEEGSDDEVSNIAEETPPPGMSPSPAIGTSAPFRQSTAFGQKSLGSSSKMMMPAFRAGAFGDIGASFRSTTTSASTAQNTSGLPNAFASPVDKIALPEFGAKLGKPAFGLGSMTQVKSTGQGAADASVGSFASMSSGFGAASSASTNPMAKFIESSSEQSAFGTDAVAKVPQYSSPEIQGRKLTKAAKKTDDIDDPVRKMIEGSDCESDREAYPGYDSD